MHWIQIHILRLLSKADLGRYIELKPDDVEGNLFMYHRGLLDKQGLIEKHGKGFRLTHSGKELVASFSLSTGKSIVSPRQLVVIVYKHDDQYLLYRWNRHPYRGLISLPFGRLHVGWGIEDMAAEQLHYKGGLSADTWKYRGTVNLRSQGPLAHSILYILEANGPGGDPTADGLTGEPFWGSPGGELMPGFAEIFTLLESKQNLFFEEVTLAK